jgi:hypothetical protein
MDDAIDQIAIDKTRNWIEQVVVGLNFCPFANRAVIGKTIHYEVLQEATLKDALEALVKAFHHLDTSTDIETTFIIFPNNFAKFKDYLTLVDLAEKLLRKQKLNGVYQIASFHPDYAFAGAPKSDAANYTNRSIYPMLHILRESSVTRALEYFPHPENIPERNIKLAREKGITFMQALRESCMK